MKLNQTNRNSVNQAPNPHGGDARRPRRHVRWSALEGRELFSVTGFSLVDQSSTFPTTNTLVVGQPTVFKDTLQQSWTQLANGQLKLGSQTLAQAVAAGIQQAEQTKHFSAYDISSTFAKTPIYNGVLLQTATGPVVELTYDAIGNQTTFTSTTPDGLPRSFDPTFHASYDLDLKLDLAIPTDITTGTFTVTASATVANAKVTTKNVIVNAADVLGFNITGTIASKINGYRQDISSIVPTDKLNTALTLDKSLGHTHLFSSLSAGGNLLLTAVQPTLVVNGTANGHISISTGSNNRVVVTAGNQTTGQTALTLEAGNDASTAVTSTSTPLSVVGSIGTVTVGDGSLAGIGGPVNIFTSGPVTINDHNDTAARTVDLSSITHFVFTSLHRIIPDTTSTVAFEGLATIVLGATVTGVTINDGSANNAYNAESSPSSNFFYVGGHFGDTLIGPAAGQVDLNLLTRGIPHLPIKLPIRL